MRHPLVTAPVGALARTLPKAAGWSVRVREYGSLRPGNDMDQRRPSTPPPPPPYPGAAQGTPSRRAHQHLPGLTGLRGVAVSAVVAYHLGYLPGGFVGVDLFFVLSGYLITSLLLSDPPGHISGMLRWWGRRIRRLTPAVAVVVLAVLVAFLTRSGIALDAFATLTWWQNWHLIAEGTPYWAGSPSPLRHAWSLSIEEQYYLIWPPILLSLAALSRRAGRTTGAITTVALCGAVASFGWAAHLALSVDPNLSRIYFGTDTRAGALLIGAATAAFLRARPGRRVGTWVQHLVLPATFTLVALCVLMEPDERWTYTGGLVAAALSSLALVVASTAPGALTTAMSWWPLQWLGDRSYAIYLWSWPIQVLVQERAPTMPAWGVAAITVGASLPLSSLSRRLVEEPLRRQSSWAQRSVPRRAAWSVGVVAVAACMLWAATSTQLTVQEQVAEEFEQLPDPTIAPGVTTTTCVPPSTTTSIPEFSEDTSQYDPNTVTGGADPTIDTCSDLLRVLVVGDSTGRGAANGLKRLGLPGLEIWDRTELGCGMVSDADECGDWRVAWKDAVAVIDPDVVLVYLGASDDLVDGRDPAFLSDGARTTRQSTMLEAVGLLSAGGARVIWNLPAVPLESGVFYCGGSIEDTPCDEDWVARWNEDLLTVASRTDLELLDVSGWVNERGADPDDRPDGLHLSGPALNDLARWIAGQLP
jgi:peptidoglycan/LPS O-acetylase OafA/YrhL